MQTHPYIIKDSTEKAAVMVEGSAEEYYQAAVDGKIKVFSEVEYLRLLFIQVYLETYKDMIEVGEMFSHKCAKCQQSTCYAMKPADNYLAPLCLSTECLYEMLQVHRQKGTEMEEEEETTADNDETVIMD